MSTVLNMPVNGIEKDIYLVYNFKQVNDAVLMLMYSDTNKCWENIFISYEENVWRTDILALYTNDETFQQLCSKLKKVFNQHEQFPNAKLLYSAKMLSEHLPLLFGVCS